MKKFSTQNERGFTFVEAVLSMMITLFGLMGVMVVYANMTDVVSDQKASMIAQELCDARLEQIVADKGARGYAYTVNANYTTPETLTGSFAGYSRTTNIYEVSTSDLTTTQTGSGLKKIDVSVVWGNLPTQTISASTLVAQ